MSSEFSIFRLARIVRDTVRGVGNAMFLKLAGFAGLGCFLSLYLEWSCSVTTLAVFLVYLATGGWRFAKVVMVTLPRDGRALLMLLAMKWNVRKFSQSGTTIPQLFQQTVKKHPNKACFLFEDQKWTFQEVESYSNSLANYFHEQGVRQGDVVALFMENRPEFVCFWLGLSKIGAVGALINYQLRNTALAHCVSASNAKHVVFSAVFSSAVKEIIGDLPQDCRLYATGGPATDGLQATTLDPLLQRSPTYSPPVPKLPFTGKLFYIYTSGTTGLPKAAIISHSRYYYMSFAINRLLRINSDDVLYDVLPLYHTAGGVIGTGQAFLFGVTVVVKKKFSASGFWDDCVRYKCTVAQYIGEICRYILTQPYKPSETQHKVRLMFGNGLRPQIWKEFQQRFGVRVMGEFYGATEGNCNIVNFENQVGAVGFTSMIAPFMYPVTLIKIDPQTGEHVRDNNGVCVKAKPGEAGELVGKIIQGDPLREFDGYVNKQATDKKVATDVFRKGDLAFLTGDVLVMDEYGYMQFRDRTGDTFRWKGENVSTSEVEGIISIVIQHKDAVVYGVEVPGAEGRAGMVAIADPESKVDLVLMNSALKKSLPVYARPLFVRLVKNLDATGTFKPKKVLLRTEAYNPAVVSDRLFYMNGKSGQFEPLTLAVYDDINNKTIRF